MAAFVYMLRCKDGSLYTGWTNDLEHRLAMHNSGRAPNIRVDAVLWSWSTAKSCRIRKLLCGASVP